MGYITKLVIFLSSVLLLAGCIGSSLPRELQKPTTVKPESLLQGIEAEVTSSEGDVIDFKNYKNQNLVVMFASYFCEVCKKEAYDLTQSLGAHFKEPLNAKLVTVIISSSVAKASMWKETQKVPWTVASLPDNKLLKKFCPEGLTPCTVIQTPQKGVVLIKQGEVHPEEIISHVGPWKFDLINTVQAKKEIQYASKISTGNARLDNVLNDPNNICAPSGIARGAHGPAGSKGAAQNTEK